MSSVLPIHTQRYESGGYTLEVTAHPSPLSQWSDRPVVRQLRFNLWVNQPERQCLATGHQQQLLSLSNAVETYVQTHLTQQSWPPTHRLTLLNKPVELNTLELFNLAEVLNAYGQTHITLPAAVTQKRRRRHWWTGSAAASLLAAVGVTTIYFQDRPAVWHTATTQSSDVALDASGAALEESAATEPASSIPDAGATAADTADTSNDAQEPPVQGPPAQGAPAQRLPAQGPPAQSSQTPEDFNSPPPSSPVGDRQNFGRAIPRPPSAPFEPSVSPENAEGHLPIDSPGDLPIDSPTAAAPPMLQRPLPTLAIEAPPAESPGESEVATSEELRTSLPQAEPASEPGSLHQENLDTSAEMSDDGAAQTEQTEAFGAIAAQLAPYQPSNANYPLVYHLQIAADGTITAIEPISAGAPKIFPQTITPAPGRMLTLEIIYTGAEKPIINEL